MRLLRTVLLATAALALPLWATLDRDGDGISDIWAALHPTAGAPEADPDGDGATNRAEALAGTDPTSASNRLVAVPRRDAAGNLVLYWTGVAGKHYSIESSANLSTWTALPGEYTGAVTALSAIVCPAGVPTGSRQFWRVVAFDVDTDSDGLNDWEEAQLGTSPTASDTDHDGMPDGWEVAHKLNPLADDSAADPDDDGRTNVQEYIARTDPLDYYDGTLPVITSMVDATGQPGAQGFVSVKVTRATGGAVLANAPVKLTVTTGASQIAGTPGGTLSTQVIARTDAKGIAKGYVRFTNQSVESLESSVQIGSQTTSISIPLSPGVVLPTGMRLWLRADGLALANGAAVATWQDISGFGSDATQGTTNWQPTMASGTLGARPVLHFNGYQFYYLPDVMGAATATAGEIYVVAKTTAGADNIGLLAFGPAPDNSYNFYINSGVSFEDFGTATQYKMGLPPTPRTDWHLYNVSAKAGEWAARHNGRLLSLKSNNTVAFRSNAYLGTAYGGVRFNGDIAEVLVFDHVLTEAERDTVATYLAKKYTLVAAPDVPTGLAAISLNNTQVSLVWAASRGAWHQFYEIDRKTGTGSYSLIATAQDTQSYIDTTAVAGTAYTYRVRVRNYAGLSGNSTEATVTTPSAESVVMPSSGLKLWLKADSLVAQGAVWLWEDQSGNRNHATQLESNKRPTIASDTPGVRPVLHFNLNFFSLPDVMGAATATAGEIYAVAKTVAGANTNPLICFGPTTDNFYFQTDLCAEGFGSTVRYQLPLPPAPRSDWGLYNVSAKAGEWVARQNGQPFAIKKTNTVAFRSNPLLGGSHANGGGVYYMQGDIAEVLVYDHVLTGAERAVVGRYLSTKYALQPLPAVPTALTAVALANTQVNVSWTSIPGTWGQSYEVERKARSGSFALLATVRDSQSYLDSTAVAGMTYTYRVRARNYAGLSDYSTTALVVAPTAIATALPVSGLKLWLKADAGTGPNLVGYWEDQSGNSNGATQVHESYLFKNGRPTMVPGVVNDLPLVRFGGSQCLWVPDFLGSATATAGELYIVARTTTTAAAQGLSTLGVSLSKAYNCYINGSSVYENFGTNTEYEFAAPSQSRTAWHVYSVSAKAGEWIARYNGTPFYSRTTNTVQFASSGVIGGSNNDYPNGGYLLQGDIAEVLAYNRVLTDPEREAVHNYLNRRYALGITSPVRDSNFDGLTDTQDVAVGVDPYNMDVDGDGLSNFDELRLGTNPFKADTDGDGVSDKLDPFPLDPKRGAAATDPIVSIVSGNSLSAVAGQFNASPMVVIVKNAAGTQVLSGIKVTFDVVAGGGGLATTSGGALLPDGRYTVVTGADGKAQVWYRQPVQARIAGKVRGSIGAVDVTFSSTSTVPAVVVPVDTDADGLADAWEVQYFGGLTSLPLADPDGDGLTNLLEYQLGRDPTKASATDTAAAVRLMLYRPRN